MAQNPDAEIRVKVSGDNSEVKKALDETQTEAEKAAKGAGDAIGDAADDSSDKVKKKSQETKDQLKKDSEEAGKKAEDTAKDTTEKVKKQLESGSVAIGNIISGLVKKITLGNLISSGISKATSTIVKAGQEFISQGIAYNQQIENYTVAFTNMLGSVGAAKAALDTIQHDAAVTPYNVETLTQANQLLIGAGENAEYAEKTIMALGDAISATGGGNVELSRMAANLQQVANVGKASSVDIKQFAYAGINIYQILADYTGKSIQQVQDMTISYDVLSQALIAAAEEGGRYYDSMNTKSQTSSGRLTTLQDNVKQLAGLMTADLTDALGGVISKLNDMVLAAQEAYKQDGWTGLIKKLTGVEAAATRIGAVFAGISAQVKAMMSGDVSEWKAFFDPTGQSGTAYKKAYNEFLANARAGSKDDNYWKEYGDRLAKQYGLSSGEVESSIPGDDDDDDNSTTPSATTLKQNARQVVETYSDVHDEIEGDVKTTTKSITKIFDDGTKQVTTTTTKAGKEIRNGIEKNVSTTETVVQEFADTTTTIASETSKTVQGDITDVEEQAKQSLSEVEKDLKKSLTDESSNGILGILKSSLTDLKNKDWGGVALNVVKLIWGEVDQEQRNVITEWAGNVLEAINQEYASGGVSAAWTAAKTLLSGGELTLGETTLDSISKIIADLTASGGMGEVLGNLVTKLGAGFSTLAANIGSVGTALGGLATKLIGVVAANPEIFAILAIAAGVAALGAYIWKKHGKDISNWWGGLWDSKPSAVSADNYRQSDSITAARLVQESQAAAAANRQSVSSVQNGTGSTATQQLNASWRGTSIVTLNLDGREVARTTAPYMDEELEFRS